MAPNWFDDWFDTPFYHLLYFDRNENEAAEFMTRLLEFLQPKTGATMLDVACGKGRHALFLSQNGFDVTGIDLSQASIAEARKFENEQLHFYQHDMRQPFRINYYDYAFNFFTSFGYFNTPREHDAAIRTMANGLVPGGTLVIDYLNVHYSENHLIPEFDKQIDGYNFHIKKWMDETHFYKKIEVEHDDFTEPHGYTEKVAKFSLGDFSEMLAFQGLQVTDVFGDYQLGTYHISQTPRMIIVAKKLQRPRP